SGRAIIDALLAGVSDPVVLAELAKARLRSKIPALREALTGAFHVEHHGLLARQMLAHIDFSASPARHTQRRATKPPRRQRAMRASRPVVVFIGPNTPFLRR